MTSLLALHLGESLTGVFVQMCGMDTMTRFLDAWGECLIGIVCTRVRNVHHQPLGGYTPGDGLLSVFCTGVRNVHHEPLGGYTPGDGLLSVFCTGVQNVQHNPLLGCTLIEGLVGVSEGEDAWLALAAHGLTSH
jgi:hypothetical protein